MKKRIYSEFDINGDALGTFLEKDIKNVEINLSDHQKIIQFVKDNNYDLYFERKILSKIIENPTHWWNGLFVMVLEKPNEGN